MASPLARLARVGSHGESGTRAGVGFYYGSVLSEGSTAAGGPDEVGGEGVQDTGSGFFLERRVTYSTQKGQEVGRTRESYF